MAKSRRTLTVIVAVVVIVPLVLAVATMAGLGLFLNGNRSADLDPAAAVNIRIHNGMDGEIDRLWLGRAAGGADLEQPTYRTRFSGIAVGADSRYLTVEPHLPNYDGLNLMLDGQRFIADTLALRPLVSDLAPGGYYTIVLDQEGDRVVVAEVTTDPAP